MLLHRLDHERVGVRERLVRGVGDAARHRHRRTKRRDNCIDPVNRLIYELGVGQLSFDDGN